MEKCPPSLSQTLCHAYTHCCAIPCVLGPMRAILAPSKPVSALLPKTSFDQASLLTKPCSESVFEGCPKALMGDRDISL
jgi:hypothetical protein